MALFVFPFSRPSVGSRSRALQAGARGAALAAGAGESSGRSGASNSARGRASTRSPDCLAERFNPRANSLDALRLLLATTVAIVHASAIAYGHQPMLGYTEVGAMAVDAFFVISGFLVTRSFLQLNSIGRYLWHRALRILPGFWVCLVLTVLVVAPLMALAEARPAFSVYPQAWSFLTHNGLLHMGDFGVAGLPTGTRTPQVVNGALWTLFYEFLCYLGVVVAGVIGALTRRRWLVVLGVGAAQLLLLGQWLGVLPVHGEYILRFALMFGCGMVALLFGDRLRITGLWGAGAVAALAVALWLGTDYRAVGGGLAFAYLCLVAVVATPWLRRRPRADLSYGMYVYHWPIETLLVLVGATALTQVGYTLLALALAAAAATVSWYLVEKPALARKSMPAPWRRGRPAGSDQPSGASEGGAPAARRPAASRPGDEPAGSESAGVAATPGGHDGGHHPAGRDRGSEGSRGPGARRHLPPIPPTGPPARGRAGTTAEARRLSSKRR